MVINSQNKKIFQIGLFVLVAIVVLGIGYASITAINLLINGNATASVNQNNFVVHFVAADNIAGSTGVSGTSTYEETTAEFDVTGLSKVGDYAIAKYTVRNDSAAIGTEITLELTSSNTEYFKVTETIDDNKLQAGEETYATIRVEMIKTPIQDDVTTTVTAKLKASPLENAEASGGDTKEEVRPQSPQYIYTLHNFSNPYVTINQDISEVTRTFNSFAAAKQEFGHPASLALVAENNIVKEVYVAFENNNKMYYVRGGVKEKNLPEKPIFESNKEVLRKAFNENECNTEYTSCNNGNISIWITNYGCVYASGQSWYCNANYEDQDEYDFAGCHSS